MERDASRELVDVVDEQNRTVRVVTRGEMRSARLPHRCTYILVFDRLGRLFIHLRTSSKDVFPSHWDVTVGGVLSAGESYDDGARRESAEELGIEPVDVDLLFPFRYEDTRSIVHGMVYRIIHEGPFRLQAEEIVRGEFVPVETIHDRTTRDSFCPDGLAVLAEYLRRTNANRQTSN